MSDKLFTEPLPCQSVLEKMVADVEDGHIPRILNNKGTCSGLFVLNLMDAAEETIIQAEPTLHQTNRNQFRYKVEKIV
jgi:hypothetical protein